jgi:nickel-dependent lactate racemase
VSKSFDISKDKLPELKKISKQVLKDLENRGLTKDEILAIFAEASSQTVQT